MYKYYRFNIMVESLLTFPVLHSWWSFSWQSLSSLCPLDEFKIGAIHFYPPPAVSCTDSSRAKWLHSVGSIPVSLRTTSPTKQQLKCDASDPIFKVSGSLTRWTRSIAFLEKMDTFLGPKLQPSSPQSCLLRPWAPQLHMRGDDAMGKIGGGAT